MKIYAAPCKTGPGAWTHQYDRFLELFAAASPKLHELTDSPEEADIVFLMNAEQAGGDALGSHPLPARFPEKCLQLSDRWQPPFAIPGIYANAPRSPFWKGRFRTGSYALHHPDFKNPFVEAHQPEHELPPSERDLLGSFIGRNCHPVRERLFARPPSDPDILIEDSSSFNAFSHAKGDKDEPQRRYYDVCRRSKFVICPRGCGPNSIRLFEALRMGIAPVIISDAWIPCEGPDWEACSIRIKERKLGQLAAILREREPEFVRMGKAARKTHEAFFAPESYINYLVRSAHSIRTQRIIPERVYRKTAHGVSKVKRLLRR